jgi:hypothetical protein
VLQASICAADLWLKGNALTRVATPNVLDFHTEDQEPKRVPSFLLLHSLHELNLHNNAATFLEKKAGTRPVPVQTARSEISFPTNQIRSSFCPHGLSGAALK